MGSVDWSSMVKYQLLYNFAISTIFGLGTERHHADMEKLIDQQIGACFCLTEIAHGTNTKAMRTTATYDVPRAGYVLHTPDFEAAKCWSGNLGCYTTKTIKVVKTICGELDDSQVRLLPTQLYSHNFTLRMGSATVCTLSGFGSETWTLYKICRESVSGTWVRR